MNFKKLNNFKSAVFVSIVLALAIPAIVLLPLPGFGIDLFITLNFVCCIILFVVTLENSDPLSLAFLPSLVLILTTFRLLLSIATTRNIISNMEVGSLIDVIGSTLLSETLIVGLLIFIIVTIVQILVVTKGAERVAEVGARFSLDAMPGKQMSIDGDLKAGLLTAVEAKDARARLSQENKLLGALDGSMKFIKGDAIAGVIISLVNLFGGIYVGVNIYGYSMDESLNRYTILTIGDGLVSQLPSLILCIACGVYLTRISSKEVGKNKKEKEHALLEQVVFQLRPFSIQVGLVALVLAIFGILVPDLLLPTMLIASVVFVFAIRLFRSRLKDTGGSSGGGEGSESYQLGQSGYGIVEDLTFVLPETSYSKAISDEVYTINAKFPFLDVGAPSIRLSDNGYWTVLLNNMPLFVDSVEVSIIQEYGMLDEENKNTELVRVFIMKAIMMNYNIQYTKNLLDHYTVDYPALIGEIDASVGLARIHDIMQYYISKRELNTSFPKFFEGILKWSKVERDPTVWIENIRQESKYEISQYVVSLYDGPIPIISIVGQACELIHRVVTSPNPGDLSLAGQIANNLKRSINEVFETTRVKPVILAEFSYRKEVEGFIHSIYSGIIVSSTLELLPSSDLDLQMTIAEFEDIE